MSCRVLVRAIENRLLGLQVVFRWWFAIRPIIRPIAVVHVLPENDPWMSLT